MSTLDLADALLKYRAQHADQCPERQQQYWRMRPEYRPANHVDQPCTCGLTALISARQEPGYIFLEELEPSEAEAAAGIVAKRVYGSRGEPANFTDPTQSIVLLPGIPGHAHSIDKDGHLSCGCRWPDGITRCVNHEL